MDTKTMNWRKGAMLLVTVIFFLFQMYLALVKQLNPMLQSPIHLILALTLVLLYHPADKGYRDKLIKAAKEKNEPVDEKLLHKYAWMNWLDLPLFIGLGYMLYYVITQTNRLQDFISILPVYTEDYAFMAITILILLVATYRTLGFILTAFIMLFIVYAFTAPYLPGILFTKGKPFARFLKQFCVGMTMGEAGIFGTPLYTSANTLFYFIIFGAFFSTFGGGQLLIDCGMKLSNKSSGGPAKAAVVSSGLLGMISGSAVANVATTGVMTIPMMKKVGYEPHEAGAVEAVASTGGQIMPPIMGVGAFIMAEMLGIPYARVASAAILPAVAYYFAVFVLVDRIAAKRANRLVGNETAKIQVDRKVKPRLYLLLPAFLLVYFIVKGASLMRAGMIGIGACLICNAISYFVNDRADFVDLKRIGECCLDGAKQAASIAIPTAACGIIINVVTGQTSLATNLAAVIGSIGTSSLFFAMLIAMIGCMILGMALPTVAAYLVGVILFVPSLQALNISPLCANMFIFYYGIMAQITPPVCVASYTAAGIADADAMKTGWTGFTFAMVGFLVPFVFVYNPAILLEGSVVEIALAALQLLTGTFFLALVVAGYFKRPLKVYERVFLFIAAILLILPEPITSVIGAVIGILFMFFDSKMAKKEQKRAAAE